MRRHGKMSKTNQLDRLYDNMRPDYRTYIKRRDVRSVAELIHLAKEYERLLCRNKPRTFCIKCGKKDRLTENCYRLNSKVHQKKIPVKPEQGNNQQEADPIKKKYVAEQACWQCRKKDISSTNADILGGSFAFVAEHREYRRRTVRVQQGHLEKQLREVTKEKKKRITVIESETRYRLPTGREYEKIT
ncbi:hypothetical protein KQX54_011023 [Cotesia glomerata]|uniref:Uncharacterized protein n=1 Tax=Cotesia glomerata TaxID=32391 RepID=A0AAV7I2E9_COTGL|nr:hypothetical protein KQX54_011023 [Cotesia glomerata]